MEPLYFIVIFFTIACLLYLFELAWIWGGLAQYKPELRPDFETPVSLIIAARDEIKNLKANIDSWLNQKHNGYELIIINDCSDDESEFFLAECQRKHAHLHVINLKESNVFKGGKKYALTLGIKGAQFERLIFTDADCQPSGPYWLAYMNAQFTEEKSIVLGFGQYLKEKGLLNYLVRMDTIQTGIQYLGLAARSNPYMGVGRNLAYTKGLFFEHEGFKSHLNIQWGDDDLFINKAANRYNTALCSIPDAITFSEPKKTFKDWFHQKRRHMSTSGKYDLKTKMLISIKPLRIILFYTFLVWGMFYPELLISFLISAFILYLAHALIFIVLIKKIGRVEKCAFFPISELFLFLINSLIYISTWLKAPTKWN